MQTWLYNDIFDLFTVLLIAYWYYISGIYRANVEYSTLRKKLASDLAVEKATAKKVEVEVTSLERSVHQMVSDIMY